MKEPLQPRGNALPDSYSVRHEQIAPQDTVGFQAETVSVDSKEGEIPPDGSQ